MGTIKISKNRIDFADIRLDNDGEAGITTDQIKDGAVTAVMLAEQVPPVSSLSTNTLRSNFFDTSKNS
ncbi:MAG: hypothetical protein Q8P93_03715 [bacterium]|nr:hypothetical protein [bacterium]